MSFERPKSVNHEHLLVIKVFNVQEIHILMFSCRSLEAVQWKTQHRHLFLPVSICPTLTYSREGLLQAHLHNETHFFCVQHGGTGVK